MYRDKWRAVAVVLLCLLGLVGCQGRKELESVPRGEPVIELFGEAKNSFGNVQAPPAFDWKQCEGTVLDFIVENNINANILSKESEKFTEVTGIRVNVRGMDFTTLTEKINMEFISKTNQYELIYVDPYQTLTRFSESLEDLYQYEKDESLPHIVGGLGQFSKEQLDVCSYLGNRDKLYSIPFDSTNMIMFYREDIFEKYGQRMTKDLGYEPLPGTTDFTWERYMEVSEWISKHVPKEEVKYGSLTMSAQHNSIYTEFSSILSAYGGSYFDKEKVGYLGGEIYPEMTADEKNFLEALEVYKQLVKLNPKEVREWNWTEINEAFLRGEVAMMPNWDENAAAVENSQYSGVSKKVGYSVLPRGDERSANIYGGSGIGINKYADEKKKLASWMFIVWATSPQLQTKILLEEGGGNMPTRKDIYRLIESKYLTSLPHASATIRAQKEAYAYYRPKLENVYDFEYIIITNLRDMVENDLDCQVVYDAIKEQWNQVREKEKAGAD